MIFKNGKPVFMRMSDVAKFAETHEDGGREFWLECWERYHDEMDNDPMMSDEMVLRWAYGRWEQT